jgi:GGDEF domain-containing protein
MFLQNTLPHMEELRQLIKKPGPIPSDEKNPRKKPRKLKRVEILANKIPVTVSIGVAERSDTNMSPHQAIQEAEKALNTAKNEGRDRMHPSYMKVEFEAL